MQDVRRGSECRAAPRRVRRSAGRARAPSGARPFAERGGRPGDAGPILGCSEHGLNLAADVWPGSGADPHAVVDADLISAPDRVVVDLPTGARRAGWDRAALAGNVPAGRAP